MSQRCGGGKLSKTQSARAIRDWEIVESEELIPEGPPPTIRVRWALCVRARPSNAVVPSKDASAEEKETREIELFVPSFRALLNGKPLNKLQQQYHDIVGEEHKLPLRYTSILSAMLMSAYAVYDWYYYRSSEAFLAMLFSRFFGIVLILGIGTLFKGGETSKKYSNKLMQLRVLLQFIAIIVLVSFAYFFKN